MEEDFGVLQNKNNDFVSSLVSGEFSCMIRSHQLVRWLQFVDDSTSIFFNKELDLKLHGMVCATVVSRHLFLD